MKYRRKYYAADRLSPNSEEVRRIYGIRQQIGEASELSESHPDIEKCQSGCQPKNSPFRQVAQGYHIVLCLIAYLIIERERTDKKMIWQKFRHHIILKGQSVRLPSFSRLKSVA